MQTMTTEAEVIKSLHIEINLVSMGKVVMILIIITIRKSSAVI